MCLVVMVTVPPECAHELARILVSERLAASVNLLPILQTAYRWDDEVVEDPESLLLIKTTKEKYAELEARIQSLHTYEIPEILAINPDHASPQYQQWLMRTLTNR